MSLTLVELIRTKTREELKAELLLALQGIGYVRKTGPGEGLLTLSGIATDELDVAVKITTAGGLGTAEFQYSIDGGTTYNGVDIAVPGGGQYVLPSSGCTLVFENGPAEAEDSFAVGDFFNFLLSIPVLPTSSWQAGSTPLTIVEVDSQANEDFLSVIQKIAGSGFLSTSADAWLDLVLQEVYDEVRRAGVVAQHTVTLEDVGNGGPYTILPGSLTVGTATGLRFANVDGGTLLEGDTLDLTFQAEQKGTAYNVAVGAINLLLTSLSGVTVTNPDLGAGVSTTQQGVNRETDAEAQLRASQKWGTLSSSGGNEDAWTFWAKEASDEVTRVKVKADPITPGGIILLLAGPNGPVDGAVVTEVEDALQVRIPFGGVLTVQSALAQNIAVSATLYVRAGYESTALAAAQANLIALFQGGTNSVGEVLPGIPISDGTEKVYVTNLVEQMELPTGVRNLAPLSVTPSTDTTLADEYIAVLSPTPVLTIVSV